MLKKRQTKQIGKKYLGKCSRGKNSLHFRIVNYCASWQKTIDKQLVEPINTGNVQHLHLKYK